DTISIDGSTGRVWLGEVPVEPSSVVRYFEGEIDPESDDADDLVRSVHRILTHADSARRLAVRTNADTPEDSARARRFGAQGIGLCRTEHMFLGDRRQLVEKLILGEADEGTLRLLTAVQRLHESNPMLGLRGVRLGLVVPGLFAMQVRAIAEAACERKLAGGDPRPEIMIPLVGAVQELEHIREESEEVLTEVFESCGTEVDHLIGTMIEVPRAALTAEEIAHSAEFFSFGTNDLTQMTWGFSRDDVEAAFFHAYLD